jgi:glutaminyl-peptide cyclotransferase
MSIWYRVGWIFLMLVFVCSCNHQPNSSEASLDPALEVPPINYTVVNSFPHDTAAYTQGLAFYKGLLYQSTGGSPKYSRFASWLGSIDLKTGKPIKQVFLDKKYFGEGITILNNKIYQLTWQEKVVFVYDVTTLQKIQEFSWNQEGWGIANNGTQLIISDGSSNLYMVDPATFKVLNIIGVADNYGPVGNLNELEYINGFVYANKYTTDYIYKIDPASGKVVGKITLNNVLLKNAPEWANDKKFEKGTTEGVLNGIAYDSSTKKIYITGKLWPSLFEIRLE